MLVLFGGYSHNQHYDDTWQFNVTTARWRQKTEFVFPVFPSSCSDDLAFIKVMRRLNVTICHTSRCVSKIDAETRCDRRGFNLIS